MSAAPVSKRPWVDMSRGRRPKKLSVYDELELIRQAQDDTNPVRAQRAITTLILYYEPFAQQLAKKAAWFTGAHREEEDLAQLARIVLFEKVKDYNFAYVAVCSLQAGLNRLVDPNAPTYTPPRLSSYVYREIRRRMMQHACKNLEIVPGSSSSIGHAAHRELDRGMDKEEVAQRFGLDVETVESLERHTVPIDEAVMNLADDARDVAEEVEFDQRQRDVRLFCWYALKPIERLVLVMYVHEPDPDQRAFVLDMSRSDLDVIEAQARRRWADLCRQLDLDNAEFDA